MLNADFGVEEKKQKAENRQGMADRAKGKSRESGLGARG
jgi:hypothetical protein